MNTIASLDSAVVRADFPILTRQVNGRALVYLDSAATSQKPRAVIDALVGFYAAHNANVHRGAHTLADEATDAYEDARSTVAAFIGARDRRELIFTRNTTEAINLVAQAWGRSTLSAGDEIVTTEMEHHSNLVPWQMLAEATGAQLRVAPVHPETGDLDVEALEGLIGSRTRLVAVTHCSNVLGTINPVQQIAAAAHAHGALLLVDAAQSAPMGIGALWGRLSVRESMPPYVGGGSMIREVWTDHATWDDPPARFEAGTPSVADAVGFRAAVDYLTALGMERVRAHGRDLTSYALSRLSGLPGLRLYGPRDPSARVGVVSFNLHDDRGALIHPHDVGTILDAAGIAIRVGQHCAHPLLRRLGVPATARASFYLYNTRAEVDTLIEGLVECSRVFAR